METCIELIKITEHNGKRAVSARELHSFLESKREFATWIKDRITKYGFVENQDFVSFDEIVKREKGATVLTEYALTLECAKEISMLEGNAKGKQARQYFIEQDKKAQQLSKPLSTLDLLELTIKGMRENSQELQEVKRDVLELKAKTMTRPDVYTIVGFATLNKMAVGLKQASSLGRKASDICKRRNLQTDKIPDPRFGEVKMYPREVLEEVFSQPVN